MEKFTSYVLGMSAAGLIYPLITAIPLAAVTRSLMSSGSRWVDFIHITWGLFDSTWHYTLVAGFIFGLGGVGYEFYRHGLRRSYSDGETWRLIQNLFWCLFYAQIIHLIGAVVCLPIANNLEHTPFQTIGNDLGILWLLGIVLFNLVALLWALIRTVDTTDVLVPHVLIEKLKVRGRL